VVDEEAFLADEISPVNHVLDGHLIDVECTGEEEEQPGEMIRPEMFVDVRVEKAIDAGYEEGQNEDEVAVDPDMVGQVVMVVPVNLAEHSIVYARIIT
jgi:hypothetical protein